MKEEEYYKDTRRKHIHFNILLFNVKLPAADERGFLLLKDTRRGEKNYKSIIYEHVAGI